MQYMYIYIYTWHYRYIHVVNTVVVTWNAFGIHPWQRFRISNDGPLGPLEYSNVNGTRHMSLPHVDARNKTSAWVPADLV